MTGALRAEAPAKVNLCLHVTGQRVDGYHLLDSLVVFTRVGDHLTLRPGALSLRIDGPESAGLHADEDNLVLRAARFAGQSAQIALHKALPVASGIGGGSADAAACLRGLSALHGTAVPEGSATLGADIPMCVHSRPARVQGIGDQLTDLPPLPPLWLVLVNPRIEVSTPAVFKALSRKDNAPLPGALPRWLSAPEFCDFLAEQRNDLEQPARILCPQIGSALYALAATPGCLLARMSGSGATCFGVYDSAAPAQAAAETIEQAQPGWWVRPTEVLGTEPALVGPV